MYLFPCLVSDISSAQCEEDPLIAYKNNKSRQTSDALKKLSK